MTEELDMFAELAETRTPAVILLDLMMTLVENGDERPQYDREEGVGANYAGWIRDQERYRQWLVELLRRYQAEGGKVYLVTARDSRYQKVTMAAIEAKTGWAPDAVFFNGERKAPPVFKQAVLKDHVFKWFKAGDMLALESNKATRAMYVRNAIKAVPVPTDKPWMELPGV